MLSQLVAFGLFSAVSSGGGSGGDPVPATHSQEGRSTIMGTRRFVVPAITDGSGAATVYSPYLSGRIAQISYIKTDYTDGVDFTITAEATGETIWTENDVNATKHCRPRGPTHSNAGVAALYASAGTAVGDKIALGRDRVKIVIAAGGAAKTGAFHIVVED
jgi:hypothetical protein